MRAVLHIFIFTICCLLFTIYTYLIGVIFIGIYLVLMFYGSETRLPKVQEKLNKSVLMDSENLQYSAGQLRALALFHRRHIISVTDSRIIQISRRIFGGFSMKDAQWKYLKDVQIDEDMWPSLSGSILIFHFTNALPIAIVGIPSDIALDIYKYSQRQEQAWAEKRRIRDLEEKRAASGGITIGGVSPSFGTGSASAVREESVVDEIRKAKELLDMGAITDAEFEEIKAKILSRSAGSI